MCKIINRTKSGLDLQAQNKDGESAKMILEKRLKKQKEESGIDPDEISYQMLQMLT
ncbi:hypothetical protein [Leptospira borgpetersenii]|uniref:hypothetical protein n=1 Tax=Leptospira borgpetersenii TaxID=174 RepID=UPI000AC39B1B|nr:hypothetical protein [Leptospira borgpetersenii]